MFFSTHPLDSFVLLFLPFLVVPLVQVSTQFMVSFFLLRRLQPSLAKNSLSRIFLPKRMASFGAPRVERDGTSGLITIHPAVGHHSATVVFCHGLGDSGEGFCDVAESMSRSMPYCKFILPTASVRPVTLNGGMKMNAWYDIVGLTDRASESCAGIDQSVAVIRALLEGEHRLGISGRPTTSCYHTHHHPTTPYSHNAARHTTTTPYSHTTPLHGVTLLLTIVLELRVALLLSYKTPHHTLFSPAPS